MAIVVFGQLRAEIGRRGYSHVCLPVLIVGGITSIMLSYVAVRFIIDSVLFIIF